MTSYQPLLPHSSNLPGQGPYGRKLSVRNKISLCFGQALSFVVSSLCLFLVVGWALLASIPALIRGFRKEREVFEWDNHARYRKEKNTCDVTYYAREAGFDIVNEEVETEDGFLLRVHRVVNPRHEQNDNARYPVLILHGLFQSSGAFVTSEERSIAFWLSEHGGYQVFLGNTRGIFGMGHTTFSRSDPRFWDWTIRELAMYDLPALVNHVCDVTGYSKIAFIGHSQGNGLAFLSLSKGLRPDLGNKLSLFVALAPAVYAGPLTRGFPFTSLCHLGWRGWKWVFGTFNQFRKILKNPESDPWFDFILAGVLDFIPLMRYAYNWVPARPFAFVGYVMFAYLFSWTDAHWLKRRKTKVFRFTPTPVSSASIFWFCGANGFAQRQCIMDTSLPQWFNPTQFPPLAVYYGGEDYLVDADSLLKRLENKEQVRLIRVTKLECEHCDFYLAANAVEWCFAPLVEDIEKTRTDILQENDVIQERSLVKPGVGSA
ncbi:hypothetical protein PILCRDRAFT_6891 [Piloderma croceum F 1598]|uniref:Partial AB-hydrolase lipase domain-containing protein n=1 Tax=Piloderma croceum (strain F 1598) TaxID=765440 RepID=A0A0C3G0A4_PILCF|nr:hypothetical protein PILCRDRAFT_6891 [Piloderma croceum F 1598]